MIRKAEEAWITELIPQYSSKGRRLYHRRSSLPPKQRLVADFFDRLKDEEIITSDGNESVIAIDRGFTTSYWEKDGKYQGLAYRKDFMGREFRIETPMCPTRQDASRALDTYISAFVK